MPITFWPAASRRARFPAVSPPGVPGGAVPSGALILDKGRWWAVVHTPQGDHPVQVTPGPAHGDNTVIEAGLQPGDDVIVVDAYLLYHRGIAALFQPPD